MYIQLYTYYKTSYVLFLVYEYLGSYQQIDSKIMTQTTKRS